MPPPTGTPGKASRAAAISSAQPGAGGKTEPGSVHFRSAGGRDGDARELALAAGRGGADRRHVALHDREIGARLAVRVDAGDDGLEHQLRAGRRAELGEASHRRRVVARRADRNGRRGMTGRAFLIRSALAIASAMPSAGTASPTRGMAWPVGAPIDTSIGAAPPAAAAAGALPCSVSVTRLRELLALLERVGPGERQRPHIGLVGGVHPVAMVLHLEGVALHAAGRPSAPAAISCVSARMSRNGQAGSTSSGNLLSTMRAVDVLDGERRADHAGERMQHDEAGAVGDEVAERLALGGEGQRAVGAPFDPRARSGTTARRPCRRAS